MSLIEQMKNLQPRESLVYYTGTCIAKSDCEEKHLAFQMYLDGDAELTQRTVNFPQTVHKNGESFQVLTKGFEYIITKRTTQSSNVKLMERKAHYDKLEHKD